MKKLLLALFTALFAGFLGGLILSEIIAVAARLLLGPDPWLKWMKYMPIYLAAFVAVATLITLHRKSNRKDGKG
ncbi:DUF5957 family protein [Geobacillus sp. TFV-3]|uniref:DUF5957 family protein n=1 Tax=Geobacillus sp. TFV-3 TaxID=1897059 RepID=UPI0013571B10|nr:DUF5957 family protein [Geobacillus sp. TFV-3]KAF0993671.1 hypothetical protein BJQ97_00279 [Geobacillus sp. TFV-3]